MTARDEWRGGGGVLIAAAICNTFAMLPFYLVGALVRPIGMAFGWPRTTVAAALSIVAIGTAILTPAIGALIDRVGPRRTAQWGVPLYAAALAMVALSGPAPIGWYAAWAVVAIVGPLAGPLVWATGVTRQFEAVRAFALSLMLIGATMAMAGGPLLATALTAHFGWRSVFLVVGMAELTLGAASVTLLFRPLPIARAAPEAGPGPVEGLDFTAAVRTVPYWLLATATALGSAGQGVVIVHLQPMLVDAGLTNASAAGIAALMGPAALIARLLSGLVADRVHAPMVAAVVLACPAVACVLLLAEPPSVAVGCAVSVLGGVALGAEVDLFAYLSSRCFGQRSFAAIHGTMISVNGIGFAAATLIGARVYDRTGSYRAILIAVAIASIAATLCMAAIGPSRLRFGRAGRGRKRFSSRA